MKRDVGGMGENLLGVWTDQIGITANRSLNKDAAGWDYILEWPINDTDSKEKFKIPFDKSPSPLKCVLQIKSTDSSKGSISVKMTNWFHLVHHPLPTFFLVLEFAGQNDCQNAYLVHVGPELIGKVQKKLRDLCVQDPNFTLSKKTMQLKWKAEERLKSLDGEGLQAAIVANVGTDFDAYVRDKQELVTKVGYEDSGGLMNVTINLPKDVDPDRHIIDFDLGIVNQLEIKGGTLFDDRFGSKLAQSELEEGSKLEIVCEPIGPGEISVTNEELRKSVRLACQVFVPSAFG